MSDASVLQRIVNWLSVGYPDGIPDNDYPSVLLVLHRDLTDAEVKSVVDELMHKSKLEGHEPVTAKNIDDMIQQQTYQQANPDDIRRVSAILANAGWPLASNLKDEHAV